VFGKKKITKRKAKVHLANSHDGATTLGGIIIALVVGLIIWLVKRKKNKNT